MATCFLFSQQLDEEHCLSLCLDEKGQVESPLTLRSPDEVRAIQANARTVVVMPTALASIHEVELPWLAERKARAAIPYALEEQLAQQVTSLHFAFDRQHYQHNHYLVVVIDKQLLSDLIDKLDGLDLDFDIITLDWFALGENQACFTETSLLVNDKAFKGALSLSLSAVYLDANPLASDILVFKDSLESLPKSSFTEVASLSHVWIAQRLLNSAPLNLCQGELQQGINKQRITWWYQASALLFAAFLVSLIAINGYTSYFLTQKIAVIDRQIAVIYREFFPQAQQVISPKFRINQLLKSGAASSDEVLWQLLDKLASAFHASDFIIEQMRFQNQVLSVSLSSKDFAALERLQLGLKQAQVKVTQTQAASRDERVIATLELNL